MIQNPKGGGLSSAFGGGNQIMGARKTSDFLEKTTWTLAIVLVSLALLSNFAIERNNPENQNKICNGFVRQVMQSNTSFKRFRTARPPFLWLVCSRCRRPAGDVRQRDNIQRFPDILRTYPHPN